MPSTSDDSPAPAALSSAGSTTAENPALSRLIAESDAAADRLLASIDWGAHDAAMADLAAQSDAAMHHYALLMQQEAEHAAGSGPAVAEGTGGRTT